MDAKFSDEKYCWQGIVSLGAFLALLLFGFYLYLKITATGGSHELSSTLMFTPLLFPIIGMIVSGVGILTGTWGFSQKRRFRSLARIGLLLNSMTFASAIIYILIVG
ncbi:MAG: hypothetical protein ABI042_19495 [Verrucomicrobiota bacterium]